MRYPDGHKDAVRDRIVEAASRALRQHGLEGIGIPALMKLAGLSHGGFYGHFEDRDELVVAAVEYAAQETASSVFKEGASISSIADAYLSVRHCERREHGCVVAALAAESPRQPASVRHAFGRITHGFLALVERALHSQRPKSPPSDDALAAAATIVGAIVLSRSVEDPALAERILVSAKKAVTSRA